MDSMTAHGRSKLMGKVSFRCLFGRHERVYWRLARQGENWHVFLFYCKRCSRPLDGHHAARSNEPVA